MNKLIASALLLMPALASASPTLHFPSSCQAPIMAKVFAPSIFRNSHHIPLLTLKNHKITFQAGARLYPNQKLPDGRPYISCVEHISIPGAPGDPHYTMIYTIWQNPRGKYSMASSRAPISPQDAQGYP